MILAPGSFQWLRRLTCTGVIFFAPVAMQAHELPLEKLNLPPGFEISIYAEVINPRQLARSPSGVVYAGSRRAGNLYALVDADGDQQAEQVITLDTKLQYPSGITYRNGDLYVGAISEILVYRDIDEKLATPPEPEVLYDQLPTEQHHGWKYLGFGPDDQLYFNVGAPCNICLEENPWFASIMRMDLTQSPLAPEVYAHGVRNTVGFTWEPATGDLWFTDNGRDWMGDELPPCELNHAPRAGLHFGYPFIHGNAISDPEFGAGQSPADYVAPALELGAHVAPLGLIFYKGDMLPPSLHGAILIAEHGSWNRTPEAGHVGYRITTAIRDEQGTLSYATLIDGWLDGSTAWGRPADLLMLPDGSLLIADDLGNAVYRLTYTGS